VTLRTNFNPQFSTFGPADDGITRSHIVDPFVDELDKPVGEGRFDMDPVDDGITRSYITDTYEDELDKPAGEGRFDMDPVDCVDEMNVPMGQSSYDSMSRLKDVKAQDQSAAPQTPEQAAKVAAAEAEATAKIKNYWGLDDLWG